MSRYTRQQFAEKLGAAERGDPKLNAAADFAARLLNGPVGHRVARIVLFGSVAGGVARPESDVDVMVFAALPEARRVEIAAEASWETALEWGESVSPLTYPRGRLLQPRPYVVYNALKRGREIFAMDESTLRRQEAALLYRTAERHLADAQRVLELDVYSLAIVGVYTAAELAAKALILLRPDVELPYTHGGMVQMFGREYVKTGEAPREWGRLLEQKLQLRSRSLYDPDLIPERDDAAPVIDLAQAMLEFLRSKLDTPVEETDGDSD